jgi:hypothetical protein
VRGYLPGFRFAATSLHRTSRCQRFWHACLCTKDCGAKLARVMIALMSIVERGLWRRESDFRTFGPSLLSVSHAGTGVMRFLDSTTCLTYGIYYRTSCSRLFFFFPKSPSFPTAQIIATLDSVPLAPVLVSNVCSSYNSHVSYLLVCDRHLRQRFLVTTQVMIFNIR